VGKIRKAVERMTRLIDSTITVAKMDAGMIEINVGDCSLANVLREVAARQQYLSPHLKIYCDCGGMPETIKADSSALEQVFTNLISNAAKYSGDSPLVFIEASREGQTILVNVEDYGLGIDEEDIPKMFDRFFRAKTSVGIAGTGIGLSVVKQLVELHGGAVSVRSTKGKGSVFTVRLPIFRPDENEAGQSVAA